jgi:hypothetical protein
LGHQGGGRLLAGVGAGGFGGAVGQAGQRRLVGAVDHRLLGRQQLQQRSAVGGSDGGFHRDATVGRCRMGCHALGRLQGGCVGDGHDAVGRLCRQAGSDDDLAAAFVPVGDGVGACGRHNQDGEQGKERGQLGFHEGLRG